MTVTVTEFFCGGGGLGLGFKQAGIDILKAYDFDKFAIESYNHNVSPHGECVSVTDLKGDDIPKSDIWTFGFPCFVPGTPVLTANGYKKIEDIIVGDKVLTHTNHYKDVLHTMVKESSSIFKLSSFLNDKIQATANHPFFIRKSKDLSPSWVSLNDVIIGDYIGMAINEESIIPISTNPLLQKYFNNHSFWQLVAYYVGKGFIQKDEIILQVTNTKINFMNDLLKQLSITEISTKKNDKYPSFINYHIKDNVLLDYFIKYGDTIKNKTLLTDVLHLPINILETFMNVYISIKNETTYSDINDVYHIKELSTELADLLAACLAKTKHQPFSIVKANSFNTDCSIYSLPPQNENAFYADGHLWFKTTNIEEESYNGLVYNLEVAEDNSYTVYNIIVHNCQDISIAGKQKGMIKGETRSGLFYEIMRLLEETPSKNKPKIILAENVKQVKNYFEDIKEEFSMHEYTFHTILYNSKNFGVAQNRERYFMLGVHTSLNKKFSFKEHPNRPIPSLSSFLEKEVSNNFYMDLEKAKTVIESALEKVKLDGVHACLTPNRLIMRQNGRRAKENEEPMFTLTASEIHGVIERKINALGLLDIKGNNSLRRVYHIEGISPTLTTCPGGNTQVKILYSEKDEELPLEVVSNLEEVLKYFSLRRLTPREYARLQGFPDSYEQIVSNSQFYKQMGNAVTVNVSQFIAEQIIEFLKEDKNDDNK